MKALSLVLGVMAMAVSCVSWATADESTVIASNDGYRPQEDKVVRDIVADKVENPPSNEAEASVRVLQNRFMDVTSNTDNFEESYFFVDNLSRRQTK